MAVDRASWSGVQCGSRLSGAGGGRGDVLGLVLGDRHRFVGGGVPIDQEDGDRADRRDRGEQVEAPRVGQAGGEQDAGDQRPGDGAEPADPAGRAQSGAAGGRGVDMRDIGVHQHLRAEDEHAGRAAR